MKHANVAIFVPHAGCPYACSFCDQRRISGQVQIPKPEAVRRTAEQALKALGDRAKDSELAFFGGSFTAMDRGLMCGLLEAARDYVGKGKLSGIRVSTRPDAVDEEVLSLLKAYGVTAVELGAQSMDDDVLKKNGRGHTAQDVKKAAALIQKTGFSLGLQMMTGLYGDTDAGARRTAEELAALRPDTVRIYPTRVMEGTPLADWYQEGRYTPPGLWETVALCAGLLDFFEERRIRVIRVGLHAEASMQEHRLAGPWHPAFGELCENERFFYRAERLLGGREPGRYCIHTNPKDQSKMTGQKKRNLARLQELGFSCKVVPKEGVKAGELRITRT